MEGVSIPLQHAEKRKSRGPEPRLSNYALEAPLDVAKQAARVSPRTACLAAISAKAR